MADSSFEARRRGLAPQDDGIGSGCLTVKSETNAAHLAVPANTQIRHADAADADRPGNSPPLTSRTKPLSSRRGGVRSPCQLYAIHALAIVDINNAERHDRTRTRPPSARFRLRPALIAPARANSGSRPSGAATVTVRPP